MFVDRKLMYTTMQVHCVTYIDAVISDPLDAVTALPQRSHATPVPALRGSRSQLPRRVC
jgi:hypothetical protein